MNFLHIFIPYFLLFLFIYLLQLILVFQKNRIFVIENKEYVIIERGLFFCLCSTKDKRLTKYSTLKLMFSYSTLN